MIAFLKGFWELIRGMGITGKHLGMHAVTIQYPEEKREMPERSRGIVVLLSDKEDGSLNCTACELCMRACPTAAIKIVAPRGEDKKKKLEIFEINFAFCCYCGLCEEACNFSALKLTGKYEYATENRDDLIWDVNKLQECGRDVPYEDKRKKKVAKKVAPKPADTSVDEQKTEEKKAANPSTDEKPVQKVEEKAPDNNKTEGDAKE